MDLTKLGEGRPRRNRTWASVCVGLFGDSRADDRTVTDGTVADGEDADHSR